MRAGDETDELARSLRRIEELIVALDALPDRAAREPARALLALVLDLHGLALARLTAMIAAETDGPELLQRLAEEPAIRAALLLHGLHPEATELRVARAVAELSSDYAERGIGLELLAVGGGRARLRVRFSGAGTQGGVRPELAREIETAVIDAAPELEAVDIEGLDVPAAELAAAD